MLLDLLFPNRCLHCNRIIDKDELVCHLCFENISFSNFDYNQPNPLQERAQLHFPCENSYALMLFEKDGLSQKLIHQLKYGGQKNIGKTLANWTTERLNFDQNKPNLIVSVPLHSKKLKTRGYNQLHIFGNELSKDYNIPVNHQLLKRNIHSTSQAKKDKVHRNETASIFSVTETMDAAHILLIDDVYTTGNTLSTIAWELLKQNPKHKISILVMAIDL